MPIFYLRKYARAGVNIPVAHKTDMRECGGNVQLLAEKITQHRLYKGEIMFDIPLLLELANESK